MPKPRNWKTPFKHFGTMISNPLQYIRYKSNKAAFVAANELSLHAHYADEINSPHLYPQNPDHPMTDQERLVIYPGNVAPNRTTLVTQFADITGPADHHDGIPNKGVNRGTMLVLRRDANNNNSNLQAAVKRGPHGDPAFANVGRTQHTTLSGGENVAAAAIFDNNVVINSSGHYQPDEASAVKLAIFGKASNTLSRREVDFQNDNGSGMDMTMKNRMKIVSAWARRQP